MKPIRASIRWIARSVQPSVRWVVRSWRDLWMLTVTGITLVALLNAGGATTRAGKVAHVASRLATENAALLMRVVDDEHATCKIQARGLPVSHQLAATMAGIHKLLTLPPSPDAPPTPPRIKRLLNGLNGHLAAYQKAEAKQPQSRSCS